MVFRLHSPATEAPRLPAQRHILAHIQTLRDLQNKAELGGTLPASRTLIRVLTQSFQQRLLHKPHSQRAAGNKAFPSQKHLPVRFLQSLIQSSQQIRIPFQSHQVIPSAT
jgi:hypothetical protein